MAAPTQGPHDHGIDLPVLVGPLLLDTLLILGFVTAGVAVALRPFLPRTDDALVAKAATLGAAAAGVSLLLTRGPADGMPTGPLAALAVVGIALPFVAARGERPRLRAVVRRAAPAVLIACAAAAAVAEAAGILLVLAVGAGWAARSSQPCRRAVTHRVTSSRHRS